MRLFKFLFALVFVAAVLGVAAIAGGWLWLQSEVAKPGPSLEEAVFEVEPGEHLGSVAQRLEEQGLISDERTLRLHARLEGQQTAIKVGEYAVPPRASVATILSLLVAGDVIQYRITIPEGLTTAQILRLVEGNSDLEGDMPDREIGEGTLLPDTYIFSADTTRVQMIERMEKAQDDLLAELWPDRQEDIPIDTPEEALILASVVEKETGIASERGLVAGLFTERLRRGMRLESDPTVIYGVSKGEPLFNNAGQRRTLYRSELNRKTDWNTYQIDGLPKTPICNPGRDAIAAVLNPPETNYIFFVADGKGGHLFAETLAEHNRNVAAYRAYEREEIARERNN
ncbi:endolytic transglycosylase MltG [Henriciella mobilis]|uniref:endolytic transglycosylase MltG n=1 Tax=Henriciella mobilis TaxID=2305467 RepID=UPI000E6654AB|nr:endolytic transglycosylase MltG [Henriciella mobilis]RIJ15666.1 endolytic transglycosylase MltG [Henriciella mobilis]RIJ19130.1 endolytic transglycosylase MltG [Henriciella mobilis]